MQPQTNSAGWVLYAYAAYGLATVMTAVGIWNLQADWWAKGYLAMAAVFLMGSTFTLAKTLRDEHEARRLISRLDEAKTEKLLKDYAPVA